VKTGSNGQGIGGGKKENFEKKKRREMGSHRTAKKNPPKALGRPISLETSKDVKKGVFRGATRKKGPMERFFPVARADNGNGGGARPNHRPRGEGKKKITGADVT